MFGAVSPTLSYSGSAYCSMTVLVEDNKIKSIHYQGRDSLLSETNSACKTFIRDCLQHPIKEDILSDKDILSEFSK